MNGINRNSRTGERTPVVGIETKEKAALAMLLRSRGLSIRRIAAVLAEKYGREEPYSTTRIYEYLILH